MQGIALPELELSLRTGLTFQDVSLQILGKTRDEVIRSQQPRVRFQDQNINRYAQNRYQNDFEYGQRVTNNARYLNRLDPTGRYTDTYPEEYEQNANQGHEYQDEYQNQYQDQYQDQYNGYPLN